MAHFDESTDWWMSRAASHSSRWPPPNQDIIFIILMRFAAILLDLRRRRFKIQRDSRHRVLLGTESKFKPAKRETKIHYSNPLF